MLPIILGAASRSMVVQVCSLNRQHYPFVSNLEHLSHRMASQCRLQQIVIFGNSHRSHTHHIHLAHACFGFWVDALMQLLCQAEACHCQQTGRAVKRTAYEAHALAFSCRTGNHAVAWDVMSADGCRTLEIKLPRDVEAKQRQCC